MTPRGPGDGDDNAKIDANTLPVEVRVLWETMLRLDPNWDLNDWLVKRANEELKLVEANLGRERTRLEQRLNRVNTLATRLKRMGVEVDEIRWNDPHQRNLFDIFSGKEEDSKPIEADPQLEEENEEHPAAALLDYLPGDGGDDPLLAIVAQFVLVGLEDADALGALPLSFGDIEDLLEPRGINPDELSEAIEWLLAREDIIEVAEDFFALRG